MRRLLIINPNTTKTITALLQSHAVNALKALGSNAEVTLCTASFGAPYIADEASYAIAGHAVIDAWAQHKDGGFDAVLIGCFGDPGLFALREVCPVPVTGLAEASFIQAAQAAQAAQFDGRFAIVTGGEKWRPILHRLADNLGFGKQLAGVHTVTQSGAELAADPVAGRQIMARACQDAVLQFNPQSVIVGGAGLAGFAAHIQSAVPLVDSVVAGVRWAAGQ
jgi:Asp/Glu/hydantoin racemase